MASVRDLYTGQFVNLDYLKSKSLKGKITSIGPHTYGAGKGNAKTRLVIRLDSESRSITLNALSVTNLAEAWGDDYEVWIGKRVTVKKGTAKFGSANVPAIVVAPA